MIAFATIMSAVNRMAGLRSRSTGSAFRLTTRIYNHVAERRLLKKLSRHSPHLMRDMGFDPEEIVAAANGEMAVSEPFRLRLIRKQAEAAESATVGEDVPTITHNASSVPAVPRLETASTECC